MVSDAYRHVLLQGFNQVAVDNRTGLMDIVRDVEKGLMVLQGVDTLLLLIGRADVIEGHDVQCVLERMEQVLRSCGFQGRAVLTGPLPAPQDGRRACRKLARERQRVKQTLSTNPMMHYSDAGEILSDEFGIVPQLLNKDGLTLDGRRELSQALSVV